MNDSEISRRVRATMAAVFQLDPAALREDSSIDSVPGWDSIGQMNLIMALEQEFGLSFSDEQAVELRSFGRVVEVVAALAARKSR